MPECQSKMAENRASRRTKSPKVFGHPPRRGKTPPRVGLYARVSTQEQTIGSQIALSMLLSQVHAGRSGSTQELSSSRFPLFASGCSRGSFSRSARRKSRPVRSGVGRAFFGHDPALAVGRLLSPSTRTMFAACYHSSTPRSRGQNWDRGQIRCASIG